MYFRYYRLLKNWLEHSLKSSVSKQALALNMWKRPKHLQNLNERAFIMFFHQLIWKMSPLVLRKILGVFVNISTADDKYRVQYCENLPVPIQMQLSQNRKNVSQFFVPFLKSTSNFQHFGRKDDRHSWCICEITDCEKPI